MTYLLQLQTSDFGLQLRTEVIADDLSQLQMLSRKMIKSNPEVKGMAYRIFSVVKNGLGKFDSKIVKDGVIAA